MTSRSRVRPQVLDEPAVVVLLDEARHGIRREADDERRAPASFAKPGAQSAFRPRGHADFVVEHERAPLDRKLETRAERAVDRGTRAFEGDFAAARVQLQDPARRDAPVSRAASACPPLPRIRVTCTASPRHRGSVTLGAGLAGHPALRPAASPCRRMDRPHDERAENRDERPGGAPAGARTCGYHRRMKGLRIPARARQALLFNAAFWFTITVLHNGEAFLGAMRADPTALMLRSGAGVFGFILSSILVAVALRSSGDDLRLRLRPVFGGRGDAGDRLQRAGLRLLVRHPQPRRPGLEPAGHARPRLFLPARVAARLLRPLLDDPLLHGTARP